MISALIIAAWILIIVAVIAFAHYYTPKEKSKEATPTGSQESKPGGSANLITGLGFLFLLGLLWIAGGYVVVWLWPDSGWANKWRYSWERDLDDATFVVRSIPHDCEFLTAPLGSKHCHYDKRVVTVRIRTDGSGRLVTTDEGKTWVPAQPADHAAVFVSWDKVED